MTRMDKVLSSVQADFDCRIPSFTRCGLYGNLIQLMGAEQFTWTGLPDNFISHIAERAINSGVAVAYELPKSYSRVNQGLAITPASFVGLLRNDGTSDKVITRGSDYCIELDLTRDNAVIIKNNDYMYSEYPNMLWFADMLARTDDAEKALIIWSKMHPIAKASSGVEADKLSDVMRKVIENDDLYSVISDNSKLLTGGSASSRDDVVLRLTDENAVEKMHFLSEFHYELIRRYSTLYNMPFRTTSKSAQSLDAELHNTDIWSQMINKNRLKCRQEAAEKISALFGVDCSVDYSELIKKQNDAIDAHVDAEIKAAKNMEDTTNAETDTANDTTAT